MQGCMCAQEVAWLRISAATLAWVGTVGIGSSTHSRHSKLGVLTHIELRNVYNDWSICNMYCILEKSRNCYCSEGYKAAQQKMRKLTVTSQHMYNHRSKSNRKSCIACCELLFIETICICPSFITHFIGV